MAQDEALQNGVVQSRTIFLTVVFPASPGEYASERMG